MFILGLSGTDYFRWQPCGYWNPAECSCSIDIGKCPDGYTMSSDGIACYILRQLFQLYIVSDLITDLLRNGQENYLDAQDICLEKGDDRHVKLFDKRLLTCWCLQEFGKNLQLLTKGRPPKFGF